MEIKSFNKAIILILGIITISIWSILIWDHFHGGVPSHHFLANKELPEISNWWGAITVPIISYLLLSRIKKRIKSQNDHVTLKLIQKESYSFFAGALYAIMISISFITGNTQISNFLFLGLPAIALFFPIYHAGYLLGFFVGMIYTFGGVLPIIFSGIMSIICYLLFILIHPLLLKIGKRTGMIKIRNLD